MQYRKKVKKKNLRMLLVLNYVKFLRIYKDYVVLSKTHLFYYSLLFLCASIISVSVYKSTRVSTLWGKCKIQIILYTQMSVVYFEKSKRVRFGTKKKKSYVSQSISVSFCTNYCLFNKCLYR